MNIPPLKLNRNPQPTHPRCAQRPQAGFTLIEVLMTAAIAAILVTVATPAMTSTIRSVQLTSATNDLFGSLLMARSEAVKRNSRVVLCKSANGMGCTSSGSWEQGWIVFQDINNDGKHDSGEVILQHGQPLSNDLRVTGNLNVARYVSYAPSGATKLVGGGFQAGTLTLCRHSVESSEARQIILAAGGRPRVQKARIDICA